MRSHITGALCEIVGRLRMYNYGTVVDVIGNIMEICQDNKSMRNYVLSVVLHWSNSTSKREIVIPGYVAQLQGELEDELGDGWKVVVGPREGGEVSKFLKEYKS